MTFDLKIPENVTLKPTITVFGVGGGGSNAVNNMIEARMQGVEFVVANTDAQSLQHSICSNKIQLGTNTTKGLGAGASPDVGAAAAQESADEIMSYLEGSNMVFITAGMGGGTGTGASPVVAKLAKEMGILTVGVVTKPFLFEGARRMRTAQEGLSELQKYVDTLIVIPNQNLFLIANDRTTFEEAFKMADNVLHAGVRGVTDLMIMPGLINLDFADIKTIMSTMGRAMMGTGEATGEDRALIAAESAISNPLLENSCIKGAKGVLINITGGKDMTLFEVDTAANRIREEVGDVDSNIIFGSTFSESEEIQGKIRVSVVATGINTEIKNTHNSTITTKAIENINNDIIADDIPKFDDSIQINHTDENNDINIINESSFFQNIEDQNSNEDNYLRSDSKQENATVTVENEVKTTTIEKSIKSKSFFEKMWGAIKNEQDHYKELNNDDNNSSININRSNEIPNFLRKK